MTLLKALCGIGPMLKPALCILALTIIPASGAAAVQKPGDVRDNDRAESRIDSRILQRTVQQEDPEADEEQGGRLPRGVIPSGPTLPDAARIAVPDLPSSLATTYEEREQSMMRDSDHCGPPWLTEVTGSALDGQFEQVCKRHDACYRLQEKTQRWCDDRMEREMDAICDGTSWYRWLDCTASAAIYNSFIRTTYGGEAYSGDGEPIPPMGEIVSVDREVIDDWFSDDEVTYCVTVRNTSPITQEYDIELYSGQGNLVDREPDSYEFNVEAGRQATECVGTNYSASWSKGDLSRRVQILLRADTPVGWAFTDDMVVVDTIVQRGR